MSDDLPSTVFHPEAFRRSLSSSFDGALHWDHWAPAINRRNIRPSDIDCIVEINGFFLICESKDEGVEVSVGQSMLLDALIQTGLFVVITRWGKDRPGKAWQVEWLGKKHSKRGPNEKQTVEEQEAQFIAKWANVVDARNRDDWRRKLIKAAFDGVEPKIRDELLEIAKVFCVETFGGEE